MPRKTARRGIAILEMIIVEPFMLRVTKLPAARVAQALR
jgi:hypothetical protein